MENASKALIMAGSILFAILIVSLLVYLVSDISNLKKLDEDNKRVEQIVKFNKQYESYNRSDLYGADIVSLSNKLDDYNNREGYKGYEKLSVEISGLDCNDYKYTNKDGSTIILKNSTIEEIHKYMRELNNKYKTYSDTTTEEGGKQIQHYKDALDAFNSTKFKCTGIEYNDNIGRITKMEFQKE